MAMASINTNTSTSSSSLPTFHPSVLSIPIIKTNPKNSISTITSLVMEKRNNDKETHTTTTSSSRTLTTSTYQYKYTFPDGMFPNGTFPNGTFPNGTFANGTYVNGTKATRPTTHGCGPKHFKWMVPNYVFVSCCNARDECAYTCSEPEWNRCNTNYYACMQGQCNGKRGLKKTWCKFMSKVYKFGSTNFVVKWWKFKRCK
jgi:hypothetical protein